MEELYILFAHNEGKELLNKQKMPKLQKKYKATITSGGFDENLEKLYKITECNGFYQIQSRRNGERGSNTEKIPP